MECENGKLFYALFHFLRNVSDFDLEVNLFLRLSFLVELSDVDVEVLEEGSVSSGVIESKCCIEIRFFFLLGYVKLNI